MKATRKDFFREIKKSSGRFISILFIVALGVAFFSGIRAAEPDMRFTGDAYFDGANLMDIKVLSTLGITEDDIKAFEELDSIAACEGGYSEDFLTNTEEEQFALHIMSMPKEMNEVAVTEGRLPEKVGECLADDEMGYQVGDTIVLESGTDEPVTDTLKTEKLTVVGTGSTPYYISLHRGSTTIGTGNLDGFLIVPEDTFALEVYTEAYMQVNGAKELMAYTDEYEDLIDAAMEEVKDLSGERGVIRRRELVDEATEELDKAKMDLEEGREKARQELEDAAAQIADAEEQIADARRQIQDGWNQIAQAKTTLLEKQGELDEARTQYESGIVQLNEGKAKYEEGKAAFEAGRPEAEAKIAEGEAGLEQIAEGLEEAQEGYRQMEAACTLADCQAKIQYIESTYPSSEYQDPATEVGQQYMSLITLEANYATLQGTIDDLQIKYDELSDTIDEAKQQLALAEQSLTDTKAMLDANEAKLQEVPEQLRSGQEQIDAGWSELYEQEQKLKSGEAEITQNEVKLADAREELEEGRTQAAEEIAEGEAKIADAEEEIADIPEAEWYIYDRSTLPEYSGYGENADRMKAIGQVFPVLFFLVAALISLTSMTRMVEEQRVQIGTMKALGYSKGAIALKYLGYAFAASILGSILGVLIGEKILPYIIIYAYGILYHHIPEILVPYVASYGVAASVAAIFCTLGATLFSCYRELGAQAAVLMRPPAPKIGKRVFLEKIPFIWKRLNFSWKSSVRNLLRYKKRFFMTILGIGGCMGLMIVGYGLRDSIYEIADIQYTEIQTYDGQILLQEDLTEEDRDNLDSYLSEDKDIERYMDAYMKNIVLTEGKKERQTYVVVLSDLNNVDKYVDFHDRKSKEKYELDDEGVIVSEKTATLLKVDVGDTVAVKNEEGADQKVTISHICENYMGHYMYMTPKYYQKVFGEAPEYNCILFAMDDSYDKEQMESAGKDIIDRDEVLSISYMHDIEKQLNDMLSSLNLVIIVLIISAGMLAFVVLYNLNTINITERQRELATLKVLGFYDPEVAIYVFRENILLTLIGSLVGIVLGRILHLFIIRTVEVDAAMFGRNINLPSFIYSFLFTVGFSLLINGIMYFKLKKISMVESLKSVE